jgi:hypothetical protein
VINFAGWPDGISQIVSSITVISPSSYIFYVPNGNAFTIGNKIIYRAVISGNYTITIVNKASNSINVSIVPDYTGRAIPSGYNIEQLINGTGWSASYNLNNPFLSPCRILLNTVNFAYNYYKIGLVGCTVSCISNGVTITGTVVIATTIYVIIVATYPPLTTPFFPSSGSPYTISKGSYQVYSSTVLPSPSYVLYLDNNSILLNERLILSSDPNRLLTVTSIGTSNVTVSVDPCLSNSIPAGTIITKPIKGNGLSISGYVTKTKLSSFKFYITSSSNFLVGDTVTCTAISTGTLTVTDVTPSTVTCSINPIYNGTFNFYNSVLKLVLSQSAVPSKRYLFSLNEDPLVYGFQVGQTVVCPSITYNSQNQNLTVVSIGTSNVVVSIPNDFSGTIPAYSNVTWGGNTTSAAATSIYLTVNSVAGFGSAFPTLDVYACSYYSTHACTL